MGRVPMFVGDLKLGVTSVSKRGKGWASSENDISLLVVTMALPWIPHCSIKSGVLKLSFESTVYRLDGALQPHGIPVPDEVAEQLHADSIRRLIVWINGYEIMRGLQGGVENGSFLVVGLGLLKEAGVGLGDRVSVVLTPDPEPDRIDLCDELLIVLEQDDDAKARWDTLTLGKQRGLAYHVGSAKREDTRIKRALDIGLKLKTNTLHGD